MTRLVLLMLLVALLAAGYLHFASDPPGYDRARFQHWRSAEAMTLLTERVLEVPDLHVLVVDHGTVIATYLRGRKMTSLEPFPKQMQEVFLPLFENAGLSHIFVNPEEGTAFVELSWVWPRGDREYHTMFLFRGDPRPECSPEILKLDEGACQTRLDLNWTLEYFWFPRFVLEDAA